MACVFPNKDSTFDRLIKNTCDDILKNFHFIGDKFDSIHERIRIFYCLHEVDNILISNYLTLHYLCGSSNGAAK
jgi:hypothetical protein